MMSCRCMFHVNDIPSSTYMNLLPKGSAVPCPFSLFIVAIVELIWNIAITAMASKTGQDVCISPRKLFWRACI